MSAALRLAEAIDHEGTDALEDADLATLYFVHQLLRRPGEPNLPTPATKRFGPARKADRPT